MKAKDMKESTDNTNPTNSKLYTLLNDWCKEAGTDLTKVCNEAGVDRSIVERWKKQPPKTIDIVSRLTAVIQKALEENKRLANVDIYIDGKKVAGVTSVQFPPNYPAFTRKK